MDRVTGKEDGINGYVRDRKKETKKKSLELRYVDGIFVVVTDDQIRKVSRLELRTQVVAPSKKVYTILPSVGHFVIE